MSQHINQLIQQIKKSQNNDENLLIKLDEEFGKLVGSTNTYQILVDHLKYNCYIIAYKAKDIINLKNKIKQYNLNLKCFNYSIYQLEYFHYNCSGMDFKKYKRCGCFDCLNIFDTKELDNEEYWVNDNHTVICPYCNIDSIIYQPNDKFLLTKEFLFQMSQYWFSFSDDKNYSLDKLEMSPYLDYNNQHTLFSLFNNPGIYQLDIEKYKLSFQNCIVYKNDKSINTNYDEVKTIFDKYQDRLFLISKFNNQMYIDLFHFELFKNIKQSDYDILKQILLEYVNKFKSFSITYEDKKIFFYMENNDALGMFLEEEDRLYLLRSLKQFQ